MKSSLRDRFGFWLERFGFLQRWLFEYDATIPAGYRVINRINGHVAVIPRPRFHR
jgi:hypothetical protein